MFGMGTGGSLRLLSPETKLSLDAIAAALPLQSDRPSNGLPTASSGSRLPSPQPLSQSPDTFVSSAPSKPHRAEASFAPDQGAPFASLETSFQISSSQVSASVLAFGSLSPLRFAFRLSFGSLRSPTPFSLLPTPCFQDQALDRLVSSSSIHYCTSTDDLSTLSSSRGLTCL